MNKKDVMKKIVAGVLLTGTIGVTACDKDVKISSYEIDKGDAQFEVNDTFTTAGFKLKLKMSDGTEKSIDITDDMITTAPDMSSSGSKDVKISYNGSEYTFKITVNGYNTQEMLNKLQQFKANYEGVKSTSKVKVNMSYNIDSRLLDQRANMSETSPSLEFQKGDVEADKAVNHIFTTLYNQITKSGLDSTINDIVDSNELKTKLNYARTLNNISTGLNNFDYLRYLVYDSLLVTQNGSTVFNDVKSSLIDLFQISEAGETAIASWLRDNINILIDTQTAEVFDALNDLNEIVQQYSQNNIIKQVVNVANSEVQDLDTHVFSSFINKLATDTNAPLVYFYELEEVEVPGDPVTIITVQNAVDTTETRLYQRSIITNVSNLIKQLENIIIDMNNGVNENFNDYLTQAINTYNELKEIESNLESEEFLCDFNFYAMVDIPKDLCERIVNKKLSDSIVTNRISNFLSNYFNVNASAGKEAISDWLNNNIDNMVQNFESVDAMQILSDFNNIIQQHSDCLDGSIQAVVSSAYEAVSNLDKNVMSTFIKTLASKITPSLSFVYNEQGQVVETEDAAIITKDFMTEVGNILEQFENIAVDLALNDTTNIGTYMANISTACENLSDMEDNGINSVQERLNANGWEILDGANLNVMELVKGVVDRYNDNILTMVADVVKDFGVVEMLLSNIPDINEIISDDAIIQIGNLVHDILTLNPNYKYEEYITTICTELGIEDKIDDFIKEFEDSGKKTCSIMSYMFETMWNNIVADPENEEYIQGHYAPSLIAFIKAVEQLPVTIKNYDGTQKHPALDLVEKLHTTLLTCVEYYGETIPSYVPALVKLINPANDMLTNINSVVDEYEFEVINTISFAGASFLGLDFEGDGFEELSFWAYDLVNDYLDETLDVETTAKNLLEIINTYCEENVKITANALAMNILIATSDLQNIDFNEIFAQVELPEVIESIDFNKLFEKITSESTYINMFKVKDIEIQYITNSDNEIIKQVLSLTLAINMDVEIAETIGEISVNIEMDL